MNKRKGMGEKKGGEGRRKNGHASLGYGKKEKKSGAIPW